MRLAIFGFILFHCLMASAAWFLGRLVDTQYPVRKGAANFIAHLNAGYALIYLVMLYGAI